MTNDEINKEYSKNISLVIDAVFLANKLTYKAKQAQGTDEFERLMRIAGKAWKRHNRRAALVPGIKQVGLE